jgi:Raf kinase inhibitor-like YbhB/YbcL family protein
MKTPILFLAALFVTTAFARAETSALTVKITGIEEGKPIPAKYAYCQPDGKGLSMDGGNINPTVGWSGAPVGTKSYALIVVDPDVPAKFDDANKQGKTIAENYPRQNFYHWVLYDIPVTITSIEEGRDSNGVLKGGKPIGQTKYGVTGPNDYARAYGGSYGGYDGPCPPWNDARLHHYHFVVYALDVPTLGLSAPLAGPLVEAAMKDHVLATGEAVGTYTQYPPLVAQ